MRYRGTRVAVSVAVLVALPLLARAQPTPVKKDKVTLRLEKLEKDLRDSQIKAAMYRSLAISREIYKLKLKKLGADHAETLRARESVATYTGAIGDYTGALAIYKELLARAEKKHGVDAVETVSALERVASQYWVAQRFEDADRLYRRVLVLKKKEHGADSPMYATYLQLYGSLLWGRGAYSSAETYYLDAKKIIDKASGPDDLQQTGILMSLGWLYWMQGQKVRGRGFFDRSLAVTEAFYAKHNMEPQYAATMVLSLASIYANGGHEDWAAPLEERGARILRETVAKIEKDKGPNATELVSPLGSLVGIHQRRKEYDLAEKLLRRLIAIDEAGRKAQKTGGNPISSVSWLMQLATLERQRGRPKAALPMLEKVRAAYKKSYGDYMAGTIDQQIADVYRDIGKPKVARKMLEKLLKSSRKTWGVRHPLVSSQLESLSILHLVEGKTKPALASLREALDIQEPNLALVLATGTESDHATYFGRIAHQLNMAITLSTRYAPKDAAAARVAMTTIFRRKGRILDAAASSIAVLRGKLDADDQKLLDELAAARARLAKLIVAGPGATGPDDYSAEIGRLESEVKRLEDQARRKSAVYRASSQPIELDRVQKVIPKDAVLVEMVLYQPYDAKKWGSAAATAPARRYAAYLLGAKGAPRWVDMGEATAIDEAADQFLAALADPDRADVDKLGRALYDAGLHPLVTALGQTKKVLVAPDGLLNLVPLGAVVDRNDKHLVRRFTFTYLTSGRDLLRIGAGAKPKGSAVIVADPSFDTTSSSAGAGGVPEGSEADDAAATTRGRRSRDLRGKKWDRLPGTGEEADALAKLLGEVRILRGAHATETALKQLSGPRILHIATHGFFLPAEPPPPPMTAELLQGGPTLPPTTQARVEQAGSPENPLLRSGLALAGANKLSSGDEDGILTALEATGLDLWGTRLVVLSACETGVGKVTEGDGVHGLRRALVIAGAETLVMSLWQVDDRATRELMTSYYKKLDAGEGRSEALRAVQLRMLNHERYSHPFYWASFVPTGNWEPLK